MLYPPQFLERVRSHFLLSELIGRRMSLKKAGREYAGLCPFHGEKTPSFTVNNEKGFFHCFGCAAHGDAIEFVKRYERCTFPEAVEKLAREAGVPIPQMRPEDMEKERAAKTLEGVMEAATVWFEKNISAAEHSAARDYLRERGITPATRQLFRIGYAPDAREGLKRALTAQGFSEKQLLDCGLIIAPESGPAYDRFRSRLMFPIRSQRGQVVAFGGRLMGNSHAKHAPKYLNSPETPLFHKSEVLFNLDKAAEKLGAGDTIVIVEGYMDCVSMVQAGLPHTVATLGTAVTEDHLRKLWHKTPQPILCLDGDAAGQRAMLRAAELALPLLKPEFSLRFAALPPGEDPDSYVQKYGKASFEALLLQTEKTGTLSQALWNHLLTQHNTATPEGLAALKNAYVQVAKKIGDPTLSNMYLRDFDGHLAFFRNQLWQKNRSPAKNEQQRSAQVVRAAVSDATARFDPLLQQILHLLRAHPSLAHKNQLDEALSQMHIADRKLAELRDALLEALHAGEEDDAIAALCAQAGEAKFPRHAAETPEQAARQLEKILAACAMGGLQAEAETLQARLALGWDDADFAWLQALQSHINDLKNKAKIAADALSGD